MLGMRARDLVVGPPSVPGRERVTEVVIRRVGEVLDLERGALVHEKPADGFGQGRLAAVVAPDDEGRAGLERELGMGQEAEVPDCDFVNVHVRPCLSGDMRQAGKVRIP